MEDILQQLFLAFFIANMAVIYVLVIAHEDVLNWWFRFGSRFEGKWFWKPIWGCYLCVSGQIALWTYLISWWVSEKSAKASVLRDLLTSLTPTYQNWNYSVLNLFIFISLTIGISYFLGKLYK